MPEGVGYKSNIGQDLMSFSTVLAQFNQQDRQNLAANLQALSTAKLSKENRAAEEKRLSALQDLVNRYIGYVDTISKAGTDDTTVAQPKIFDTTLSTPRQQEPVQKTSDDTDINMVQRVVDDRVVRTPSAIDSLLFPESERSVLERKATEGLQKLGTTISVEDIGRGSNSIKPSPIVDPTAKTRESDRKTFDTYEGILDFLF